MTLNPNPDPDPNPNPNPNPNPTPKPNPNPNPQDDPRRLAAVDLIGRENPSVDPSGAGGEWFKDVSGYDRRSP